MKALNERNIIFGVQVEQDRSGWENIKNDLRNRASEKVGRKVYGPQNSH